MQLNWLNRLLKDRDQTLLLPKETSLEKKQVNPLLSVNLFLSASKNCNGGGLKLRALKADAQLDADGLKNFV